MELDLAPFNLPAALENALTLIRERAARHGLGSGPRARPRWATLWATSARSSRSS